MRETFQKPLPALGEGKREKKTHRAGALGWGQHRQPTDMLASGMQQDNMMLWDNTMLRDNMMLQDNVQPGFPSRPIPSLSFWLSQKAGWEQGDVQVLPTPSSSPTPGDPPTLCLPTGAEQAEIQAICAPRIKKSYK